jgi:peptide/nickel transport system substrate-binding protein
VALVIVVAVALASAGAAARRTEGGGGIYRVGWADSFSFTDGFDPTGEYANTAAAIYTNLLLRTLVGYDHVAGSAGNRLVPDLAVRLPNPSDGGKTYTFRLRRDIDFGPPLNRPVTSSDVAYAFERLADPNDGAEYSFYYTVIRGFPAYAAGKASRISGISTPDPRTIVFRLSRATGDFLYRLAMPATAPIPHELAHCFEGQPGRYGRDLVSTGPYMIAGAEKIDASSCAAIKPMSGFDGQTTLTLVRNPNYSPASDSSARRQNSPDEFRFTVDSNATDILDQVAAGQLDDEIVPTLPPQTIERYSRHNPHERFHHNPSDATLFIVMNLTQPPFDDIHVRRALNWVIDKAALRQLQGGLAAGAIANHIVPDGIFQGDLAGYRPYATARNRGDVTRAKAALGGSRYDIRGDGTCSAAACKHVLLLADTSSNGQRMLPVLEADAKKIGITFTVRTVSNGFPIVQTPRKDIPIADFLGWGKDYPDPYTYLTQFDSRNIRAIGNTNFSLVGISPKLASLVGVTGDVRRVPNIDARLDRCAAEGGRRRRSCYEGLDRYVTTEVVPWVPYLAPNNLHLTSTHVVRWGYDQSTDETAFAHVAVRT